MNYNRKRLVALLVSSVALLGLGAAVADAAAAAPATSSVQAQPGDGDDGFDGGYLSGIGSGYLGAAAGQLSDRSLKQDVTPVVWDR